MSRITVAALNARVNGLAAAQATTNELLAKLVAQVSAYTTPALVVDLAEHKAAKADKAAKATAPKTTKATTKVVSLATAQKRVDAGEDAWKITVKSSNGNPVPFGVVLRATKAQARTASTDKAAKPSTKANPFFGMSKAELVADGSVGAQAEIDRRNAKKAAKSA